MHSVRGYHKADIYCIAINRNGSRLATGRQDRFLIIFIILVLIIKSLYGNLISSLKPNMSRVIVFSAWNSTLLQESCLVGVKESLF